MSYPSGFVAQYGYTALGYASTLTDGITSQVEWTLNALDAEQHIIHDHGPIPKFIAPPLGSASSSKLES